MAIRWYANRVKEYTSTPWKFITILIVFIIWGDQITEIVEPYMAEATAFILVAGLVWMALSWIEKSFGRKRR